MAEIRKLIQSFTRPADTTAYANGDLIANSTTAASVTPMQFQPGPGGWRIVQARVSKTDETDVANSGVTLHLFETSPTVVNGDNGALSTALSGFSGLIVFPTLVADFVTDEAFQIVKHGDASLLNGIYGSTSTFYALLEADAAYTPASGEIFTISLWVENRT